MDIAEKSIVIDDELVLRELFGNLDRNIRLIKDELDISITPKDNSLILTGPEEFVDLGLELIGALVEVIDKKKTLYVSDIRHSIDILINNRQVDIKNFLNYSIGKTSKGKEIKPKTWGQRRYVDSMLKNDIVFGIGPAGTGKTYLAMAMAADALKNKKVSRIILTRPAVEAGESLGFLPGDLQEKVDPYLRPVYDALFDILGFDSTRRYMDRGVIEVAPLAYMRGRTLESAYVILDEAQNTTNEQMKMILTRLGYGSKLIVTGDITQVDLSKRDSGLRNITKILKDIKGIDFIYLSKEDIVRHHIVQKIIEAYERYDKRNG